MTLFATVNPATGETVEEFDTLTGQALAEAVDRAQEGFEQWRDVPVADRCAALAAVAQAYDERSEELARTVTTEMGKPVREAAGELKLCSMIYAWYAERGPELLADEVLDVPGADRTVVRRTPVGVVLGVMPWNFPHYQVARFAAPNLLLGNALLLKPAPSCPRSSLQIEEMVHAAGVPDGAYQSVFADDDQVATLIADPRVQGVSLTGSERAGAAVAEVAGRNLTKVVLELGGSDPFIVLDSADVDATVKAATRARLGNAGQACNAPKRMYVADTLHDDFVQKLTASFAATTPGDPSDPGTRMGPLSSAAAADRLLEQVDDAVAKGATVLTGGRREGTAYVDPIVLVGVTPEMRAWSEELFGPVAVVHRVTDADEAVGLANDSSYGLSGSVWGDPDQAQEVAGRLDVGMAFVNEHGTTLPGLPFGGVKRSGFGRELGPWGLDEFANKKLVRVSGGAGGR